jgi:hypothetical protein
MRQQTVLISILMLTAIVSAQTPSEIFKQQNDRPRYVYDDFENVRLPQRIPNFALLKDYWVSGSGKSVTVTTVMLSKRPAGLKDPEVIEYTWAQRDYAKPSSGYTLMILEGGPSPHPKLMGKISRDRAVLIWTDYRKAKIAGAYPVVRTGNRISVTLPSSFLSGYELFEVDSHWLPNRVKEPFKTEGVLAFAANRVMPTELHHVGSFSIGNSIGILDRLH